MLLIIVIDELNIPLHHNTRAQPLPSRSEKGFAYANDMLIDFNGTPSLTVLENVSDYPASASARLSVNGGFQEINEHSVECNDTLMGRK